MTTHAHPLASADEEHSAVRVQSWLSLGRVNDDPNASGAVTALMVSLGLLFAALAAFLFRPLFEARQHTATSPVRGGGWSSPPADGIGPPSRAARSAVLA